MSTLGRPPPRPGNKNTPLMADPAPSANPGRPTTRSSVTPLADIIEDTSEVITDAKSARKFLDSLQFCIPGEAMTLEHLSHSLFYISQKVASPTLHSMIRATAFLAVELTASPIITLVQEALSSAPTNPSSTQIASQNEELRAITTKLDSAVDNWSTQQDNLKKTLDKVPQIDDPTDLLLMDARIQSISEGVSSIQAAMDAIKTQPITRPTSPTRQPHSYRNAVASMQQPNPPENRRTSPGSDQAAGCSAIKQRQLLLDPDSDHPLIKNDTTTEKLAEVFQQVLDSLKTDVAPNLQLHSLFRLRNQGIVLELTSADAARWVKHPIHRVEFTEKLGGKIRLKDRQYNVVVSFLPISTDINSPDTARSIEIGNDLPDGTISKMRWIKDPSKRDRHQRVAHALFSITNPEAANKIIDQGLYVNLECLRLRKDKREPICCLKCQHWGHFAKDCKEMRDTCGTCAKEHRTTNCCSFQTFYCVNCKTDRHASSDRECPEYIRRQDALDRKTPENSMPYFPTEETWTQELLPLRQTAPIVRTRKPASQPSSPKRLTQTRLPFTLQALKRSQESNVDADGDSTYHTAAPDSPPRDQAPVTFPNLSPLLPPMSAIPIPPLAFLHG